MRVFQRVCLRSIGVVTLLVVVCAVLAYADCTQRLGEDVAGCRAFAQGLVCTPFDGTTISTWPELFSGEPYGWAWVAGGHSHRLRYNRHLVVRAGTVEEWLYDPPIVSLSMDESNPYWESNDPMYWEWHDFSSWAPCGAVVECYVLTALLKGGPGPSVSVTHQHFVTFQ